MTNETPPAAEPSPAVAASGPKPRPWRAIVIVGAIVVFLGIVLFAVRNNVSADDLKVGDCFNVPNGSTVKTVERHGCTESHTGEVILVAEYTGTETVYPIAFGFDSFAQAACTPAFETYVGRAIDSEPALSVGYFYPTSDGWSSGDRTITCYVANPDNSEMSQSVKASTSP